MPLAPPRHAPPLYVSATFNLYLNYDGNGGKFGATSVAETDSDTVNSSVYTSVDTANALHLVVLNKKLYRDGQPQFQIAGSTIYPSAQVYAFDANSSALTLRAPAALTNNRFSYTLSPLTAAIFSYRRPRPTRRFCSSSSRMSWAGRSIPVRSAALARR